MICQMYRDCHAPAVAIIPTPAGDRIATCADCAPHPKERDMTKTTTPTLAEQFHDFITGAADAALWSTHPMTADDFADQTADEFDLGGDERVKLRGTLAYHSRDWFVTYYPLIRRAIAARPDYNDMQQIGHDWWLTTQGHGAGFWDRGLGNIGATLTATCDGYSDLLDLYVDEDGNLRVDTYNVTSFDEDLQDTQTLTPTVGNLYAESIDDLQRAWREHVSQQQHAPVKGQLTYWTRAREARLAQLLLEVAPDARDHVLMPRPRFEGETNVDMALADDVDAPDVEFTRVVRSEWVGRDHDRGEDYYNEDTEVVYCSFDDLADEMDETVSELIVNLDALADRPLVSM